MYPAFIKLDGRKCLVVGAGNIAVAKAAALLKADADVTVVAPNVSEAMNRLAENSNVTIVKRTYQTDDVRGHFLVVASTDDETANRQIFADAEAAGKLVNVVDVPELCNFYVPSVVRKGELEIAISTNGASPGTAKQIRRCLEDGLSDDYGPLLIELREFREALKELEPDGKKRMKLNLDIAESSEVNDFLNGQHEPLRKKLTDALAPYRNLP